MAKREARMDGDVVPEIVIGRLPLYLRALDDMVREGKEVTSSQELGERLGISSAQIRKDLSQFGEFGKQGTGYGVGQLVSQLRKILKVDRTWDVVLVGAGDLGRAIANYGGFVDRGFRIVAVFDKDPAKVGKRVGQFTVQDTANLASELRSRSIVVAMLAVPAGEAQGVTDRLVKSGVRAILCYAPTSLVVPASVHVQYIDPVVHMQRMTFYLPS
jgi:redox-sensing transcriptional repressor